MKSLIQLARDWVNDVLWEQFEREEGKPFDHEFSDKEIKIFISEYYDGGWGQFVHDSKL